MEEIEQKYVKKKKSVDDFFVKNDKNNKNNNNKQINMVGNKNDAMYQLDDVKEAKKISEIIITKESKSMGIMDTCRMGII